MYKRVTELFKKADDQVRQINSSKIFAGLVVVILNISSKYVNIRLSKSMESYLKHNFSRNIMVAAILWMGSRDIYVTLMLTAIFVLFADFLFNDDSFMCVIPESIKQQHIEMADKPTEDEIKKAREIVKAADSDSFATLNKKENVPNKNGTSAVELKRNGGLFDKGYKENANNNKKNLLTIIQ
jgi:hypothetical protein